jgi:catechol 2,3-dioxygenase-like lactoylglutathione lyase family enzyme
MGLRLEAVTFAATDVAAVAAFWSGLLGRKVLTETDGVFLPGDDAQVGLRFVISDTEHRGPRRLHLHLTSVSLEHQQRTVEMALRLGGSHLDVGQGPDDLHVVLADPGGNELCVIEPGDNYLADTGYLGEVTCDGTRRVGLFWRDALGWPLVWDHDEQTGIQSKLGGTKVSWDPWGGQPYSPKIGRVRQHFDLVADDLASETERLVSLGATLRSDLPDGVELADPDGNEFELRSG